MPDDGEIAAALKAVADTSAAYETALEAERAADLATSDAFGAYQRAKAEFYELCERLGIADTKALLP